MSHTNHRTLIHLCVGSEADFKRNFQGLIANIKNGDYENQLNFTKTLTNLLINDTYSLPKKFYAFLLLAKIVELKIPNINDFVLINKDLFIKITIDIDTLWDEYKVNDQRRSYSNLEKTSKNYLRLLLEFAAYLDKNYGMNSQKVQKLVKTIQDKNINLPRKFVILEKSLENFIPNSIFGAEITSENNDDEELDETSQYISEEYENLSDQKVTNLEHSLISKGDKNFYKEELKVQEQPKSPTSDFKPTPIITPYGPTFQKKNAPLERKHVESPAKRYYAGEIESAGHSSTSEPDIEIKREYFKKAIGAADEKSKQTVDLNFSKRHEKAYIKQEQNNSFTKILQTNELNQLGTLGTSGDKDSNNNQINSMEVYLPKNMDKEIGVIEKSLVKSSASPYKRSDIIKIKEDIERSLQISSKKSQQIYPNLSPDDTDDITSKLERQLKELKQQNEYYKQELEHFKRKNDEIVLNDLLNQLQLKQNELENVKEENSKLKVELSRVAEGHDLIKNKNNILSHSIENSTREKSELPLLVKEINVLKTTNEQLLKEIEGLKLQNNALTYASRESTEIKENLNDLKDKNTLLQASLTNILGQNQALMKKVSELEEFQNNFLRKNPQQQNNAGNEIFSVSNRTIPPYKPIKGIIIDGKSQALDDVKNRIKSPSSSVTLKDYKLCCLGSKTLITMNEMFDVNMIIGTFFNENAKKNSLRIILYYNNRGTNSISNFMIKLIDMDKNLMAHIDNQVNPAIVQGKPAVQTFTFLINSTPFVTPSVSGSYTTGAGSTKFCLALPVNIVKFMNFKPIDLGEFRMKWSTRKNAIFRSNEVDVDPQIIENANAMKNYFNHLIDLKSKNEYDYIQGKAYIKYAGIFELDDPNIEYYIKMIIYSTNKIIFQIAYPENNIEMVKFIIQTLVFLFGNN